MKRNNKQEVSWSITSPSYPLSPPPNSAMDGNAVPAKNRLAKDKVAVAQYGELGVVVDGLGVVVAGVVKGGELVEGGPNTVKFQLSSKISEAEPPVADVKPNQTCEPKKD